MEREVFESVVTATVSAATAAARHEFQEQLDALRNQIRELENPTRNPTYEPVTFQLNIECNESLDLVKSLPEFSGDATRYVSWRQAVFAAHALFESFVGSSKYYQAIAIIRNKIIGSADLVLSSFNTVLNFHAIIARLDFTYSDKRPIYILEQEMSLLRQGPMSLSQYYDEVEKKLSLIVNKVIMTNGNNCSLSSSLCQKYREDALRIFISGLRRPMCDILFSSRPADLPSALALAQELECNRARVGLANSFNYGTRLQSSNRDDRIEHFPRAQNPRAFNREVPQRPDPMEIDPSLSRIVSQRFPWQRGVNSDSHNRNRVVQQNNGQGYELSSDIRNRNIAQPSAVQYKPNTLSRVQNVNYLEDSGQLVENNEIQEKKYCVDLIRTDDCYAPEEEEYSDLVNFFGEGPPYHISRDN